PADLDQSGLRAENADMGGGQARAREHGRGGATNPPAGLIAIAVTDDVIEGYRPSRVIEGRSTGLRASSKAGLPAFARPRRGQDADQQQKPDHAGEYRQDADAAHDTRLPNLEPEPVVAVESVAANAKKARDAHT